MKKKIAILGSTGSIGTQALEVVDEQPDHFEVVVLTAQNNAELLIQQALKYQPKVVVIVNTKKSQQVRAALSATDIDVLTGTEALNEVVLMAEVEVVLTALVGYAGLLPTITAIKAGKNIALANKETLVVAGQLIYELLKKHQVSLYPVDSEHSAIFQCLPGEERNPIEKIILTASGGPFRGQSKADLALVTKAQALKHPNWSMGAKITIDSASMMNKGLEVIEAKWLFDLTLDQIEVVVHPQSIVHSLVQFQDGSIKAQLGLPDMKLPIQYALTYPKRLATTFPRFDFLNYPQLTFEQPDLETFQNLALAYSAIERGGNIPCILNAANEIAVERFLKDEISFLQISELNALCMEKVSLVKEPSLQDLIESNNETRRVAAELF